MNLLKGVSIYTLPLLLAANTMSTTAIRKKPNKILLLDRDKCISCAGCVGTCPDLALDMFGLDLQVFQDKCTYCTICVRFCPVGALAIEKTVPIVRADRDPPSEAL